MGSTEKKNPPAPSTPPPPKRHVVFLAYPAQGHITPMLNLAKLLHSTSSFHVSFVNTHHTHQRLLNSGGLPSSSSDSDSTFRFFSIPDGLPPPDNPGTNQHIPTVSSTINFTIRQPFTDFLVSELCVGNTTKDDDGYCPPPVSLIIADTSMNFALSVAKEFGIQAALLWTASSCALLGYAQYQPLCDLGIVPFKDSTFTTNGSLDEVINYTIPSMEGIRIRDLPSFIRTTDREDPMLNTIIKRIQTMRQSSVPILLHTFDALEGETIRTLSTSVFPDSPIVPIGPLRLLLDAAEEKNSGGVSAVARSNLWKEDTECIEWLDSKPERSVLYVNFGSLAFLTKEQVEEVAKGLRDSERCFLWIVRPDLVELTGGGGGGDSFSLSEFAAEVEGTSRGMIRSWCDQDRVLRHRSVAGLFTHCGWNSMLESLGHGVPMICWAYFADQMTTRWFCCRKWGAGVEVGEGELKREVVERVVREVVGGEKGKVVRERAQEWKRLALEAVMSPSGSSFLNFNDLVNRIWA